MPAWVDNAFDDYARRIPRQQNIRLELVPLASRKSGQIRTQLKQLEAEKICHRIKPGSYSIALDEKGRQWSTSDWVSQYRQWQQHHPQVNFIIGGPDGLDPALLKQVDRSIALGPMTMPHGLVRVVLIEQLYRAWSVLQGHPYHRD